MSAFFFCFLFCGCVMGLRQFHEQLTRKELATYFGEFGWDMPSYDLVSPVHVHGSHVRRYPALPKDSLTYNLTVFGENFTLLLDHNDLLVSPDCVFRFINDDGNWDQQPCVTDKTDCYYHGVSVTHDGSSVALSTCYGLTGQIHVSDRDYDLWIQPVEKQHVLRARRSVPKRLDHPHIVFKTMSSRGIRTLPGNNPSESGNEGDSTPKYIASFITYDETMEQATRPFTQQALLSVVNVASSIFCDATLGVKAVEVIVKGVMKVTTNTSKIAKPLAETMIKEFCPWQMNENFSQDVAVHFTGVDIHGKEDSSVIGYAYLKSACIPRYQCAVVEFRQLSNTLQVAQTCAHEYGHLFGLHHDGNNCVKRGIMLAYTTSDTPKEWSNCSRLSFKNFVRDRTCLNDRPDGAFMKSWSVQKTLNGSADELCHQFHGKHYHHCQECKLSEDQCKVIRCQDAKSGTKKDIPRDLKFSTEGLSCSKCSNGKRRYCVNNQCVRVPENWPDPVNAEWGSWTGWSDCGRSCGGGVQYRNRTCDIPRKYGGKFCEGKFVGWRMCNLEPCARENDDFRDEQCIQRKKIEGAVEVRSYVNPTPNKACRLHCSSKDKWYERFETGTPCPPDKDYVNGRCADGVCLSFDCKGEQVDTSVRQPTFRYDKCRHCKKHTDEFQNSGCLEIRGSYQTCKDIGDCQVHNLSCLHNWHACPRKCGLCSRLLGETDAGYFTFLTVEKECTSVLVEMITPGYYSKYRLKLGSINVNLSDGVNSKIIKSVQGMDIYNYYGPDGLKNISIPGPLTVAVEFQVNPKYEGWTGRAQLKYSYYMPKSKNCASYAWTTRSQSCNCTKGAYDKIVECVNCQGETQEEEKCQDQQKPSLTGLDCREQCNYTWVSTPVGICDRECRTFLTVTCQLEGKVVPDSFCTTSKPSEYRNCTERYGCGEEGKWKAVKYGECSVTCDTGHQIIVHKCVNASNETQHFGDHLCGEKPEGNRRCYIPCERHDKYLEKSETFTKWFPFKRTNDRTNYILEVEASELHGGPWDLWVKVEGFADHKLQCSNDTFDIHDSVEVRPSEKQGFHKGKTRHICSNGIQKFDKTGFALIILAVFPNRSFPLLDVSVLLCSSKDTECGFNEQEDGHQKGQQKRQTDQEQENGQQKEENGQQEEENGQQEQETGQQEQENDQQNTDQQGNDQQDEEATDP